MDYSRLRISIFVLIAVVSLGTFGYVTLEEMDLYPDDIYSADEAFISSTLREIMPVIDCDGNAIGNGKPGPHTKKLHRALKQLTKI